MEDLDYCDHGTYDNYCNVSIYCNGDHSTSFKLGFCYGTEYNQSWQSPYQFTINPNEQFLLGFKAGQRNTNEALAAAGNNYDYGDY